MRICWRETSVRNRNEINFLHSVGEFRPSTAAKPGRKKGKTEDNRLPTATKSKEDREGEKAAASV